MKRDDILVHCDLEKAVNLLKKNDNMIVITHKNPDGDAIGSSFGLYFSLLKMGKKVIIDIGENIPKTYSWIYKDYNNKYNFDPKYIISVDLADTKLLPDNLKIFENKIDLSIDHHPSNNNYAKDALVDATAASTTQLLYNVILKLIGKDNIDKKIASCLYLGLTTDTGCFRYSSVTAQTHQVAADLIKLGANHVDINKKIFDTKSKDMLMFEQEILSKIEYHINSKCAIIFISKDLKDKYNIADEELEGLSVLPIQIEGVEVGVTIKEKEKEYKISIRTSEKYDASEICKHLGGGGHKRAGGCSLNGPLKKVKQQLIATISQFMKEE